MQVALGLLIPLVLLDASSASDPPSWTAYPTAEAARLETIGYTVIGDAASVATGASADGHDAFSDAWRDGVEVVTDLGVRPSADPDGADYTCAVTVLKPYGHADRQGRLQAQVDAHVNCNFESAEIRYNVVFMGYDAISGDFAKSGPTAYRFDSDHCRGARAYHSTQGACTGSFDHYGRAYGGYRGKDGGWYRLIGSGVDGSHAAGSSASTYC